MVHTPIHLFLHFALPGAAARFGWPSDWKRAWVIMASTLFVDLDHLLADPIFDPGRCSIGTHPFHSPAAIVVYLLMTAVPRLRIAGAGLLIHMGVDLIDCLWMAINP